jgi:ribonuclease VapC
MVLDTSAMLCVLLGEPEAGEFIEAIAAGERRAVSAATWVETVIVITARKGQQGRARFDRLLATSDVEMVPVDAGQAELAYAAWQRYGKGRHEAGLNFGDCFAYALARQRSEPLLFKGEDFSKTDVRSARAAS